MSVSEDARYTLVLAYDITPLAGRTALVVCYRFCTSGEKKKDCNMSVPSSLAFLPESFHRVAADGETIYGWVANEDDAQQVIASVNREFTTSFISW